MNSYQILNNIIIFTIFFNLIIISNCFEDIINTNDLNELSQCFYQEKISYEEKEEITYEILNNNFDRTLFIQFKSVDSIIIYESLQNPSNVIFTRTKDENNFGNYYFILKKNIEKYYIKIEISQEEINDYVICFNLFEEKGNTFKKDDNKSQKISSIDVINSGKFPFYINENLSSFTALRFHKNFEKFFSLPSFNIKVIILNTDEEISFYINELYERDEYYYLIWNLDIKNNMKIKEIFIEANLNIINEEKDKKFELELVDDEEIHFEYKLIINKSNINEIPVKIYYINLKKYLFQQDLDILFLTNNLDNEIFISNSDNFNNNNIIALDKKFIILNKNSLEKYQNINPYLLLIIIDESFILNKEKEIFFNILFAGSSHDLYMYKEDIKKDEFFTNNKLLIKSDVCRTKYYINYFSDTEKEIFIEYESILGNINIYQSNRNDLSNNINDYFLKLNSFPITDIDNSIINGDYGIIKLNCPKGQEKILSYIYSYEKNLLNNIIDFQNQKILLFIEKNKGYEFKFNEKLKEEKFNFRIRIFKKSVGKFNLDIVYNNNIYSTLNEENFIELKHETNMTSSLKFLLTDYDDISNENGNYLILEIIKEIGIEKNNIKIYKSNIQNSVLEAQKYLFFEYEEKSSSQISIILKNNEIKDSNICVHKGYGIYPYLIRPNCEQDEVIVLKQNEEINLIFENPYLSNEIKNINNNDNPLYISVYSDNLINFSYEYEKYSILNITNKYKDIDFKGKEIIQLGNTKNYPSIYYQINLCQDINSNFQEYSFEKPLLNYYFSKKEPEINNIYKNIYKEEKINSNNPKIIFNNDGNLKAKFKYIYGNENKLNYNENYSKKITVEQNKKILKISLDSPFNGDIIVNIILITSDFDQYNGYCDLIDLYENLKFNEDIMYYGQRFIQKSMFIEEGNNKVNIEIESEQILDLNRKNAKIYVITTLKETDFDAFYNPISLYMNLNDYVSDYENRQKLTNNIIIGIILLIFIFLIFITFRNCKNKNSEQINYERKSLRLNDGVINESNKLFV